MKLVDAIANIQYDANWQIWAELIDGKLEEESEARYGQSCFENGGILDDYQLVCNGEQAGDHLQEWRNDETGELIDGWFTELVFPLNEALAESLGE